MKLLRQFRALFRKDTLDREMSEEMRHHLELQIEENTAAGMNPDEARYRAQRQFGHVEGIKEIARDARGIPWLEELGSDIRYGTRQLRKAPGFTAVAILTLALGIGATTAIFSIVNSVILRPLDYPDPARLVALRETVADGHPGMVFRAAYFLWAEKNSSFSGVAAFHDGVGALGDAAGVDLARVRNVTTNYFSTVGIAPALGRDFTPGEGVAGHGIVAVLSHRFWLRKFSGDPAAINQVLRCNDQLFTIVGVLPPNREFDAADLFFPLSTAISDRDNFHASDVVEVVARLKPGVALGQAAVEMNVLSHALADRAPVAFKRIGAVVAPLLDDVLAHSAYLMTSGVGSLLFTLLGAVGFLLLIACVNVANLLLARASARQKEIALRAALGASRGRIVRQLLCESLMLAALGGGLGTLLGYWSLGWLRPLTNSLPRAAEISLDGRALAFSCFVTLLTGVGFGLLPALRAANFDLIDAIKDGGKTSEGRRSRRLRSGLIVAEIALAMVLLVGAGLLIHSFLRLQQVKLGFRSDDIYANRLNVPPRKYATPEQQVLFVDEVRQRVAALPQVSSVAFTSGMPIFGSYGVGFTIAGRPVMSPPQPTPGALYAAVTPGYFETMGITLLRGRGFSERDVAGAPRVAIISEAVARKYFPGQDPIGQRLSLRNSAEAWREIVGIASDVMPNGPAGPTAGNVYEPFAQNPGLNSLLLVVHTRAAGTEIPGAVRSVVQSVNPDIPLNTMYRLTDGVAASIAKYRLSMILFAFFSGIALVLAAIGIYGVMAYNVAQRTGEIGIRMALGAQREDVLRLILGQGGRLVMIGLALGLAGALATSRFLASLLYNLTPNDPVTLVAVALLLALIAFLACWLPARRATKVDPLVALRHE